MRPLRRSSSLVRVIATLGVLITIQAAVVIRYGSNPRQVESWLPTDRVTLWGDVGITVDRLILLAIGSASALGLWLLYRSSQFGLATEAVSESERSAAAIGLVPQPDRVDRTGRWDRRSPPSPESSSCPSSRCR